MTPVTIELPALTKEQVERMFPFGLLMLAEVGSKSHGTYVPKDDPDSIDDIDLMGVYAGPIESYLGFGRPETIERKFGEFGPYDCVSYDLRHFVGLFVKSNPNVLGMLWMKREHILHLTPAAEELIANRQLFATKAAYKAFSGYARAQLHRMTHFDGPARRRMQAIESELRRRMIPLELTPKDLLASRPDLHDQPGTLKPGETADRSYIAMAGGPLLMEYRQMCNRYTSGYMGQKRRELVERYGYDTKNASHLIRLLKMGIEFLRDGELHVDRTGIDAEELKAIKRGEWALDDVQKLAEELFAEGTIAHEQSTLRETPDVGRIEKVLVSILSREVAA
jgi:hypothetical protein